MVPAPPPVQHERGLGLGRQVKARTMPAAATSDPRTDIVHTVPGQSTQRSRNLRAAATFISSIEINHQIAPRTISDTTNTDPALDNANAYQHKTDPALDTAYACQHNTDHPAPATEPAQRADTGVPSCPPPPAQQPLRRGQLYATTCSPAHAGTTAPLAAQLPAPRTPSGTGKHTGHLAEAWSAPAHPLGPEEADEIDALLQGASTTSLSYDSDDDTFDVEERHMPPDAALEHLFGGAPPNPAAIRALHERYPLFKSTSVATFGDIIRLSDRYAPRHAIPVAAAHAAAYFATHARLDRARIDADMQHARAHGMAAFLRDKAAALAYITIQHVPALAADPRPDLPSMPPRPPHNTLDTFHASPLGTRIQVPAGFSPNGCPPTRADDPGYELAKEYIFLKDHHKGRSSVLPLDAARDLFKAAGYPFSSVPYFITTAVGKPEGRLVVDVTRAGLNAPAKRDLLTGIYGPIVYPRTTDFCRLHGTVQARYPGEPLVMFKADYEGWFKRILLDPTHAGLLTMVFNIDDVGYAVVPHVGQFGCQEFNYAASQASAFIYARVRDHQLLTYGTVFQHVYSDDNVGCCPARLHPAIDTWTTANAAIHAGQDAQPDTKKEVGTILTALGALYDIRDPAHPTVGLSEGLLLKLVRVLFVEFQLDLSTLGHTRVPLRLLQRLGSYLGLAAEFLLPLRPFAAGVYANTRGPNRDPRTLVRLTRRTVGDIASARALVYSIVLKPDWLRVPMWVPPLTRMLPTQTPDDLAAAQLAAAHAVVTTDARGADASGHWGGGALIATPTKMCAAWMQHTLPSFEKFLGSGALSPDELAGADQINLYEAIEAVLACDYLLSHWETVTSTPRPAHPHIHVLCDNTSAISWLTKFKHRHPLIAYVLQTWAHLQCQYGATITMSHLAGKLNIVADAISRDFNVPHGPAIRSWLQGDPVTYLGDWWHDIVHVADHQALHPQDIARAVIAHHA